MVELVHNGAGAQYTMGLGHSTQWGWGTVHNGAGIQYSWGTMGLAYNGTGAQWGWGTMGLIHNGAGAQWGWHTMGLGHNGAGIQWGWYTMGLAYNGADTQWGWHTMGLRHNGAGAQWGTVGLVHSGTGVQWGWGTMVLGHNGTGTHRDGDPTSMWQSQHNGTVTHWGTVVLVHNGAVAHLGGDSGTVHSGVGTVGLYTVGWGQWDCTQWGGDSGTVHNGVGTVGLYTMGWGHSRNVTQWSTDTVGLLYSGVGTVGLYTVGWGQWGGDSGTVHSGVGTVGLYTVGWGQWDCTQWGGDSGTVHSGVGTVGLYTVGWGQWDCTQWGGDSGTVHNGVGLYTVGWGQWDCTQWGGDSGTVHNGVGTVGLYTMGWGQWDCTQWGGDSGTVHNGVGTVGLYTMGWGQWDCTQWGGDSGTVHNGVGTVGLLHNGVRTQWDCYTVGWSTVGLYAMRWGHSGTVTQWGRGTVDCPRAAVPQIFAVRIFCGIYVACLWSSLACSSIWPDDSAGGDSAGARQRAGQTLGGAHSRRPQSLRRVRLLLHVPPLPTLPSHAHTQQVTPLPRPGWGLHPHPYFLRHSELHSYIHLLRGRRPVHAQLSAQRVWEAKHHAREVFRVLPGTVSSVHAQHQLSDHCHHAAEQPAGPAGSSPLPSACQPLPHRSTGHHSSHRHRHHHQQGRFSGGNYRVICWGRDSVCHSSTPGALRTARGVRLEGEVRRRAASPLTVWAQAVGVCGAGVGGALHSLCHHQSHHHKKLRSKRNVDLLFLSNAFDFSVQCGQNIAASGLLWKPFSSVYTKLL